MTQREERFGFVAVLGAPNVGKSTLVNQLVGAKVSIVTPKVQTTRSRVLGIAHWDHVQAVLVDTPGIFEPKKRLERAMVHAAWQGTGDADVILLVVDVSRVADRDEETATIVAGIRKQERKAILVLNKIDLVPHKKLLELSQRYFSEGIFSDVVMISAMTGDGVDKIKDLLAKALPPGPWHFPPDQLADMPLRLLAAEITREKLFLSLHQELPYALTVETENWEEFRDGTAKIEQVIFVEREGQRAIILGHQGQKLKHVRVTAQKELEELLGRKIHLFLFVKVRKGWGEDRERYGAMGLEFDA